MMDTEQLPPADAGRLNRGVGRPVPEREVVVRDGYMHVIDGPKPPTPQWNDHGGTQAAYRAISTAPPPRDGTRVLLFDPVQTPKEMIGRWRGNAWWGDPTPSGRCSIWRDETGCYWMPLPPEPSA
jgi:hypothetical protein